MNHYGYGNTGALSSTVKVFFAIGLLLAAYVTLAKLDIWHHPGVDGVIAGVIDKFKSL